jgi:hypothetical protein
VEKFLKLILSTVAIAVIASAVVFIHGLWSSQLDVTETLGRAWKKITFQSDVVAVRDPDAIYQNGTKVGVVTAAVAPRGDLMVFEQLVDTSSLDRAQPFEYQRQRLRVVTVERQIGLKSVVTSQGSSVRQAVLENVVCARVQ